MSGPNLTVTIPADTPIRVDLDVETFGRFFADAGSRDQAAILASIAERMARHPIQWDYISIDLARLPNETEIRAVFAMLGQAI